eukprot:m.466505 g.466505  ORF g.466505 m.466505 type:complete len:304 (-) comp57060_c0_seq13:53-964(-)
MAEGSVRVDANISVRPTGSTGYGVRTEVKNISGVRFLAKAIDFEYARQVELLEQGQPVLQETRTFDAASGKTVRTRGKEGEVDYRYMPEPDIPPLIIASQFVLSDTLRLCGLFFFFSSASLPPGSCQIEEERTNLPELPMQTAERFIKSFGLDEEHALAIILAPGGTAYFEACMQNQSPELALRIANWIVTELFAVLNDRGDDLINSPVSHTHLADLTRLLHDSVISGKIAKEVFARIVAGEKRLPSLLVREENLAQITDNSLIEQYCDEILAASPQHVSTYHAGKMGVLGVLIADVLRRSGY